jgi:hypothetical protein
MTPSTLFFHRGIFRLAAATCILFFLMTALAMLLYPGGTFIDPSTRGYSFFANFFSDLGATRTPSGATNTLSMVLFTSALTIVGFGLAVFFIALTQFFRNSRHGSLLPAVGAFLGVVAGLCFVGVAFTPEIFTLPPTIISSCGLFAPSWAPSLYMASPSSAIARCQNDSPSPSWPSRFFSSPTSFSSPSVPRQNPPQASGSKSLARKSSSTPQS